MKKKTKKVVKKATSKKTKKKTTVKKAAPKKVISVKAVKKTKKIKPAKTTKPVIKTAVASKPVVTPVAAQVKKAPETRFSFKDVSMNKTELEKFRKVLEEQLNELQSDFGKKYQSMNTTALPDINDQASAESERNFEIRIKDRERKLIGKVQEALKKVAEGTYGICESCGEAIGSKRLMARPVTNLCINCKAEMEADEKREESLLISMQQSKSSPL
jgi:DnaK suppressor protein